MITATKVSNGYKLEIRIDKEALLKEIDDMINEANQVDFDLDDKEGAIWEYQEVYGDYEEDFCSKQQVLDSLEAAKTTINGICENPDMLFDRMQYKKNDTFKKNTKPQLWMSCFGPYWEDSYGWRVYVIRIEPDDDTVATVRLDKVTEHY